MRLRTGPKARTSQRSHKRGSGEPANASSKSKEVILQKGEDDAFTVWGEIPGKIVDMHFANMKLVWNDAYREVTPKPLTIGTVDFAIDPGLTEGKNR